MKIEKNVYCQFNSKQSTKKNEKPILHDSAKMALLIYVRINKLIFFLTSVYCVWLISSLLTLYELQQFHTKA
jgi:hypothetical protein